MKNITRILLLLIPSFGMAQQSHFDSLKIALKTAQTDSARVTIVQRLGDLYSEIDRNLSIYYYDQAFLISKKDNHAINEAFALRGKGYVFVVLGKYSEALACFQQALKLAEDPLNERKEWQNTDKIFTPHKFRVFVLAGIHLNLGNLLRATGDTSLAIVQYRLAKQFAVESGADLIMGLESMNVGNIYLALGRLDSALAMNQNAEQLFKKTGYVSYLGYVYNAMGIIYLKKENAGIALQYFHKAVNTNIHQGNFSGAGFSYGNLASYYLSKNQKDSSLYYSKKALEVFRHLKDKTKLVGAYENLYKSYQLAGNTDSAYKYQGIALLAKDSIYKATIKSLADFQKLSFKAQIHAQELETEKEQAQTRVRTYALLSGIGVLLMLAIIFYRNNRQKQRANYLLSQQKEEIEIQRDNLGQALEDLNNTQTQLIQSEKMASLGELTAGIAHEIQNPLNFVNNFSEVSIELLDELKEEAQAGHIDDIIAIATDLTQNLEKIIHHGKRADFIVKGMLQHSRTSTGEKQETNINILADEFLKLSYHGLRAKDKNFNAELITNFDENLPKVNIAQQDIGRVLLNLFNNAFYAVNQKQKTAGADYKPEVAVSTSIEKNNLMISVKDNGNGIPDAIKDKIMQPFFTTKPTGEGTGLGLSLSYDIVAKGHGGELLVESEEGKYTEFKMILKN